MNVFISLKLIFFNWGLSSLYAVIREHLKVYMSNHKCLSERSSLKMAWYILIKWNYYLFKANSSWCCFVRFYKFHWLAKFFHLAGDFYIIRLACPSPTWCHQFNIVPCVSVHIEWCITNFLWQNKILTHKHSTPYFHWSASGWRGMERESSKKEHNI